MFLQEPEISIFETFSHSLFNSILLKERPSESLSTAFFSEPFTPSKKGENFSHWQYGMMECTYEVETTDFFVSSKLRVCERKFSSAVKTSLFFSHTDISFTRGLEGQPITCYQFQQGSNGLCHPFKNNLIAFYLVKMLIHFVPFEEKSFQKGPFCSPCFSLQGRSFRECHEQVIFSNKSSINFLWQSARVLSIRKIFDKVPRRATFLDAF